MNKVCSGIGSCNNDKGLCKCEVSKTSYDNYNGLLGDIKILNCQLTQNNLEDSNNELANAVISKIKCDDGNKKCSSGFQNCQPYCECDNKHEGINCEKEISDDSKPWFGFVDEKNILCSNRGKKKDGKCICEDGFSGDNCGNCICYNIIL